MKTRGFTLIELMIVLAIIAILAAIVFPLLNQAVGGEFQPQGGTTVHRVDANTPQCVNGILLKNGDPIVVNGAAVKC